MYLIHSKLDIDIFLLIQKISSNYILDLPFFKSNIFNRFFSFKKFIIFSFIILFKRIFTDEVLYSDIFLNLNLNEKELGLRLTGFITKTPKLLPFLNSQFLPTSFNKRYSHFMYKFYNKSKFLKGRQNFLKVSENPYARSIFVTGHVFQFYRGSITPFYKAKFSWLLSTGLKADVECDDLEADKAMFNRKELDNYNNIYEDHSKDIVFKVYNFKKSFTRDFKKKARHYITYAFYQDWGIKRFISEKKSVFFYKQIL